MRRLAALLLLSSSIAAAQVTAPTGALSGATRQVIAYLPDLQSSALALALKQAAGRGVRVFVVAPRNAHMTAGSFLPSVALANAETPPLPLSYHFNRVNALPFLLVDNRAGFIGNGLVTGGPSVRAMTPAEVASYVKFSTGVIKASPAVPARVLIKERFRLEH